MFRLPYLLAATVLLCTAALTAAFPGGTVRAATTGPTISALSPTSVAAGSNGFTLTVTGSGFTPFNPNNAWAPTSHVYWHAVNTSTCPNLPAGDVELPTYAKSTTELAANVPPCLLTIAGTVNIYVGGVCGTMARPANASSTRGTVKNLVTASVGCTSVPVQFSITGTGNPAPVLSGISPDTATAGSTTDIILTVTGSSFVSSSVVEWNGTSLVTDATNAASGTLSAVLPASDLATPVTGNISVYTPASSAGATDGGSSATLPFYVTPSGVSVSGSGSGTSASPSGTATASTGGLTSTASGSGTVTVAQYSADPTQVTPPAGTSGYFDVNLSAGSSFSSLTITQCGVAGTTLYYFDAGSVSWLPVSNQTLDPATGCITATITATTAPSTIQLTGTPFAVNVSYTGLQQLTGQLVTNPGVARSLNTVLQIAGTLSQHGSAPGARALITVYDNLVRGQIGRSLTAAQAQLLIRLAASL